MWVHVLFICGIVFPIHLQTFGYLWKLLVTFLVICGISCRISYPSYFNHMYLVISGIHNQIYLDVCGIHYQILTKYIWMFVEYITKF
jgi:hypothetical protein